jgi:glycine zipper-containing protein DUF883
VRSVDISTNSSAPRRHPSRDVSQYVRDEPLAALAIATAAGFVLGGGVNRRIGLAMLTMVGRTLLSGVTNSLILGMVTGNDNARQDSARHGGQRNDNGRAEFQKPG